MNFIKSDLESRTVRRRLSPSYTTISFSRLIDTPWLNRALLGLGNPRCRRIRMEWGDCGCLRKLWGQRNFLELLILHLSLNFCCFGKMNGEIVIRCGDEQAQSLERGYSQYSGSWALVKL